MGLAAAMGGMIRSGASAAAAETKGAARWLAGLFSKSFAEGTTEVAAKATGEAIEAGAQQSGGILRSAGKKLASEFGSSFAQELGSGTATALTDKLREKLGLGSKAAVEMGQAHTAAATQATQALDSAATAAHTSYNRIVTITNNVYNLQGAYVAVGNAATGAGSAITEAVSGAGSGNLQQVAAAYRETSDAAKQAGTSATAAAAESNAAHQTMQSKAQQTPAAITKAWETVRGFMRALWEDITRNASEALQRIKTAWSGISEIVSSVSKAITWAMDGMSSALSKAAGWISSIRTQLMVASVALSAGIVMAVKAASDDEVALRRFNAVLGESADGAKKWAEQFSAGGLGDFGDTITRLTQLRTLLDSLNFNPQASTEFSQQILSLATDLAAFNGMKTDEVFEDLMSAITGSSKATKFYAGALTDAAIKQKMLEDGVNPETATDAEKAYARFTLILQNNAAATGYAAQTANTYDGTVRALRYELQGLYGDIGELLKGGYEKLATITLGIVRAVREWISGNQELAGKIAKVVDWSTSLGGVLSGAGVVFTGMSATLAVLAGVVGTVISPLGLLAVAVAKAAGAAEWLQSAYETAFDGALKKAWDFVLSAKIFGVSVADWFRIGAMQVKAAWSATLSYVMEKVGELIGIAAGAYESFLQLQIGGASVGNWIAAGLKYAESAFYSLKAVALDAGLKISSMWVDGKVAMLDFWAIASDSLQKIALEVTNIYYTALRAWAGIKAIKDPFGLSAEIDRINKEAAEAGKKIRESLDPQKARKEATAAQAAAPKQKAALEKQFSNDESRKRAEDARKEGEDLLSGKKDATAGYIEAERGVTASVVAEMQQRQAAFAEQAAKIRNEIQSIVTNGSGGSGIEIDKELQGLLDKFAAMAKSNPMIEEYKKLAGLNGSSATEREAKATAEGSFKASEVAGQEKDQTQNRIAEAVEQSAKSARDTADGVADLNSKLDIAS